MKNNQGFTLIELIVVIAVMAIIAGVSSNIISTVSNQELKDFVNNLDAMLNQCKVETVSGMNNPRLDIVLDGFEGEYWAILSKDKLDGSGREIVKRQFLAEDYLECTYDTSSNSGIALNNNLTVTYDRTTGELKTDVTKIKISNGRASYAIKLISVTGYHSVVKE